MRTPLGKISWGSLALIAVDLATIVAGIIVGGRTGTMVLVAGIVALCAGIYFEVGLGTIGLRNRNIDGKGRRPL